MQAVNFPDNLSKKTKKTKAKEKTAATAAIMPLFGGKKKPESKKAEEVVKPRTPTVEDKYDLKDVLGT